ncbi:uncharacterized protein LOC116916951 [Daphnia magna]|uniref:uncharacterized protein LOC116916951 n=1 Tax=Daphnia magna TaxID=35525 RepID=UPI001E1BA55B|nr:uncharacterized protein LOC116916951 [Daphnia magna]
MCDIVTTLSERKTLWPEQKMKERAISYQSLRSSSMCRSFEQQPCQLTLHKMSLKREIIMHLYVLLLIPLMCAACAAVSTDTAGIYNPVLPHRRMPQHTTSWTYPYYFDYPYPTVGQQTNRRLSKAAPAAPQKPNTYYYYPYRYPYPYHYLYQNPSPVSPDFHAVNQVEFIEPIASYDFSGNAYSRRPWKTGRLHPHPTVTIMGPGGAGGGGGD